MKYILITVLMLATATFGVAHANGNFVSLGAGTDCTFNTLQGGNLQDVLNSTPAEIRLVNNVTYIGQFVTTSGVVLKGGYDSCADATDGIQSVTSSVIDGNFQGTTLTLDANGAYTLQQVALINGSNPSDRGGGLLLKAQDMTVILDRTTIENNEAKFGGGIFKGSNLNVLLTIKDSVIKDNFAGFNAGLGGGIYFDVGGELVVYGDTHITENQATAGGGLFLDDALATFIGGPNTSINSGITLNKATAYGGGLYAKSSTVTISGGLNNIPGIGVVGEAGKNFNVFFNESDSDQTNNGDGGGLYFDMGSSARLEAVTIALNKSNALTGGMMVNNGSVVDMGRPDSGLCQVSDLIGCNFIVQNTAKNTAGGLYVTGGAKVTIQAANFSKNRANIATAAYINGVNTQLTINSSVFHENGDLNMSGGFFDQYALLVFDQGQLEITHSTAVKNRTLIGFIGNSDANLSSYNNYFFNHQSGPWLIDIGTAVSDYECLMVDSNNNTSEANNFLSLATLTGNDSVFFVDEANSDYHLSEFSNLVDWIGNVCPTNNPQVDNSALDIDGQPRTSFADLGADENLSNDIIFADGFE